MTLQFDWLRLCLILGVAVYFAFEWFDRKRVQDEREEMIRLRTYEFINKASVLSMTSLAVAYLMFPWMNAIYPILLMICATLYAEIAGKLYYRRKY